MLSYAGRPYINAVSMSVNETELKRMICTEKSPVYVYIDIARQAYIADGWLKYTYNDGIYCLIHSNFGRDGGEGNGWYGFSSSTSGNPGHERVIEYTETMIAY